MLKDINNFLPLTDKLSSSGMPTKEQLNDIANDGVQVVINLALPTSEKALPNESSLVRSLHMKYIGIPVEWDQPTKANLKEFMDAMDAYANQKVHVHCQANYRATAFIALYRIQRRGWNPEEAFKDLHRIWDPDGYPIWKKFIQDNLPKR
ncbi:MAG TPA: protein tyrosine phosphatase family protein [Anaerolineales bacterium]|nr:protein tyrosine phosphatase family protein [Anaerolineales bacterium]